MIHPRFTWAALFTGLAALGSSSVLAQIPVLVPPAWAPKVSAACIVIAAVALAVTAAGRSIVPAVDAGPKLPTPPSSAATERQ